MATIQKGSNLKIFSWGKTHHDLVEIARNGDIKRIATYYYDIFQKNKNK